MRTRMYGGVRGRKTKIGGKPTFVFLLLDYQMIQRILYRQMLSKISGRISSTFLNFQILEAPTRMTAIGLPPLS